MQEKQNNKQSTKSKRKYLSQSDVPSVPFDQALRVAQKLSDEFAKQPTKPLHVATALDIAPTSSRFRTLTGASVAYGLTSGAYNASEITLTDIGKRVCSPIEEGDDVLAKRAAFLKPRVINEFLTKYNNNKLPSKHIAANVLEEMGVPNEKSVEVYEMVLKGAEELSMMKDIKGNKYVDIKNTEIVSDNPQNPTSEKEEFASEEETMVDPKDPPTNPQDTRDHEHALKPIFIAHGKDKKPLDQLKGILDKFKIPYKIAIYEANSGRPVSEKVGDIMSECGSAIFIFSKDGESENVENKILPNLNVTFELGAASVLYGNKIIIFKEEDLDLPSDFSGIAHISFSKDQLKAKTTDLLTELIEMGFVKITPA